jgi:hypothetical protein
MVAASDVDSCDDLDEFYAFSADPGTAGALIALNLADSSRVQHVDANFPLAARQVTGPHYIDSTAQAPAKAHENFGLIYFLA